LRSGRVHGPALGARIAAFVVPRAPERRRVYSGVREHEEWRSGDWRYDMDLSDATVGQLLIPVEDLDRGVAFYRDTLGLRHLFSAPPQMSFFQTGNVRLLVGVPEAGQPRQRGSQVYFRVADIHAVFRTLVERGVEFAASPHVAHRTPTAELWLCEFKDPDGNQLALMSETAKGV